MKRKILLCLGLMLALVCLLAVAVSATTVYKDENGTELFKCEIADGYHIDSYEILNGGFAKADGEGNALTWYLDSTATENGVTVKYVKSVKTADAYANGAYTNGVDVNLVVSASFDAGTSTVPEYGKFSGTYNKELLFIYVPDAVKSVPMRFCQNVPVVVCEFGENSQFETMGDLAFWGAKSLRSLFIPKNFKKFPNSKDGEFKYCNRLEELTFHKESTLETMPSWAFASTKIKKIIVPDSVTYLNSRAFQGMVYLEYVDMGKNVTHMYKNANNHSMFYGCGSLKTVIFPPKLTAECMIDNYGGGFDYFCSVTPTFVITGSLDEFLEIQKIIGAASNSGAIKNATVENGKIVVADYCETYYGGHIMLGEERISVKSYFEPIEIVDTCKNCGKADVKEALGAIFTYYGYSYTEFAINGEYSMSQFYGVNSAAKKAYTDRTGDSFEFGLVVAAVDNPFESELLESGKVLVADESSFAHNYFNVKIRGITEAHTDSGIVFCAYVKDGGEIYYLDGGVTSKDVQCKSYNAIKTFEGATKE